jgi:hypothetical protein
LGVNRELVADVFDVLALKSEEVENAGGGFTLSGAFSAAGVGVAGTSGVLLAPVKRFFAGAVAGGATVKPANGFEALGAGVALTAWSAALFGKVIRLKRSPPDALGVAELSVGCSVFDEVVSVGFETRLKRSLPALAAGCEAPKMFEVLLLKVVGACGACVGFSGLSMASSSPSSVVICVAENEKAGLEVCSFCQPLSTLVPAASPLVAGAGEALLKVDHPSAFGASVGLLKSDEPPWKGDGLFCSVLG